MNRAHNVVFAALLAAGATLGWAQTASANLAGTEREFALQNSALQEESTSMPVGSPKVDVHTPAADPLPRATTLAQEESRFAHEDRQLQREATGMPAGSPAVNRLQAAADPLPKATTRAQKTALFDSENRFLQQASTR